MKKELIKLYELLRDLGNLYNNQMVVTASVLVQNMSFDAEKKEEKDFTPYLSILKKMKEYDPNNHMLQWAFDEADMTVQAEFFSKDIASTNFSDDDIDY